MQMKRRILGSVAIFRFKVKNGYRTNYLRKQGKQNHVWIAVLKGDPKYTPETSLIPRVNRV